MKKAKCKVCGKDVSPSKRRDCCGKTMCTKCLIEHFEGSHRAVK